MGEVTCKVSDLDRAKIAFSDAVIGLEIAQGKFNEKKANLVRLLNTPPTPKTPTKGEVSK